MLKIETYKNYENLTSVWKMTISDYYLAKIDFTKEEKVLIDRCNKPEADISMVALGLALIAKKIERMESLKLTT